MLLVKLDEPSARGRYIIQHMLEGIGGIPVRFAEGEEFRSSNGPKLVYGALPEAGAYHIPASEGWAHTPLRAPIIDLQNGRPNMFPSDHGADPFAVAFYVLSLADEMQCADRDAHGRVPANSLYVVRNGLSDRPYVDEWALRMAQELEAQWPGLIEVRRQYTHTVTVDMDNILRYAGRPFVRALGASAKDLLRGAFGEVAERWSVRSGARLDPYLAVRNVLREQRQAVDRMVVFFLVHGGEEYDHAASLDHPDTIATIQGATLFAEVGIHPSYRSSDEAGLLRQETERLRSVVGSVALSRQHFLRWRLPDTMHQAMENGIAEEHSLGFSDRLGFRASTCTPFRWFDVERDQATGPLLVPFAAMDSALIDHERCMPRDVVERMSAMGELVRQVNGNFVSVWHDRSLSGHREFASWPAVFKEVVQRVRS